MGHIHGNGEYDFTASAVIVHNNKVLLQFHHKLHFWIPPGGHIELHERPMEALYREIEEETGLTKDHLTLLLPYQDNLSIEREDNNHAVPVPFDIDTHTVNETGHKHIDLAYIFASDTGAVRLEPGGAEKLEWFTLEEIEKLSPMPRKVHGYADYALTIAGKETQ